MAVSHVSAIRNALASVVGDAVDAGSSAGYLEFQTSGDAEVATLTFSDPAFGSPSSGVITAGSITSDSSATGGTVAKFRIFDSSGTEVLNGTVTATDGGGDIELSTTTIGAGTEVAIDELTYTAPL